MLEEKKRIMEIGKRLYQAGLATGTEGNISVRLADGSILITASGANKGNLSEREIIRVDLDGKKTLGTGKPSTETAMHLVCYRERPDVKAIIHAHPPYCVALTLAGIELNQPFMPESVVVLGKVPTAPYARPSTQQVPASIMPFIPLTDLILLERHGSLTMGADLEQAYFKLQILENTARTVHLAYQVGKPRPLPQREVMELNRLRATTYKLTYPIISF